MTQTVTDPVITQRFSELPQVIKTLITDSGWQFKIRDLVKKFNIRIDQGGTIEHEIFLVMMGFDDAKNFIQNVMNETGLDQKTTEALAAEVGTLIFDPIREALIAETNSEKNVPGGGSSGPVVQPIESREDLLKEIEDPVAIPDIRPSTVKAVVPTSVIPDG